jgi:hypothetical protein
MKVRKDRCDWKAGVHTPRLASVKGAARVNVEIRSSVRGMVSRLYNKFPIQRRYLGACPEVFHSGLFIGVFRPIGALAS